MPPPRLRLVVLGAALLAASLMALLVPRPAGAAPVLHDRWRWPVQGAVAGRFAYSLDRPFAAGARRGIDIAATPGAAVRSACSGRVTFAGAVPGGRGLGVTVRCGALAATHLGLGRLAVRHGARVAAGARLGVLGAAGRLRLGARRAADRFGYVDPLRLLRGDEPPDAPPAPTARLPRRPRVPAPFLPSPRSAPLGRAPRAPALPTRPLARAPLARVPPARALPSRLLGRAPHAPASPGTLARRPAADGHTGGGIPAGAWGGLVLLAAGVPLGGLLRRGRRRAHRAPASAHTTTAAG